MPLQQKLNMRLFDRYVEKGNAAIPEFDVSNGEMLIFQSEFLPAKYVAAGGILPATAVTVDATNARGFLGQLSKIGQVKHVNGKLPDYSIVADSFFNANARYFGETFTGYYSDQNQRDDLLLPNAATGEFSLSFWIYPLMFSAGTEYTICACKIAGSVNHRFIAKFDGSTSNITCKIASSDGSQEFSISCVAIPEQWNLVVVKCESTKNTISISCKTDSGFVISERVATASTPGCLLACDRLRIGVMPDAMSDKLSVGRFYLQQVCMWRKILSDSESNELFSEGRGTWQWFDGADALFQSQVGENPDEDSGFVLHKNRPRVVDLDASGAIVATHRRGPSPGRPIKNCDNAPLCFPNAMVDDSPDAITLTASWSAAAGGCLPVGTSFTLTRKPLQIVNGFRFGRTFESEKLPLLCGGYIQFFLESTPSHWSKFRYRQYLGVESSFGGQVTYSKFFVTMGSALVKNPVTGGSNKFTSPSPTGVNFDFPYSDSFGDYASDIMASGWTPVAMATLEEPFPVPVVAGYSCNPAGLGAACIVASKYRFGVGVDRQEIRSQPASWYMGVSECNRTSATGAQRVDAQDSYYNYEVTCNTPGYTNNSRTDGGLPFSAIASGLIGTHNKNGAIVAESLPFDSSTFSAILVPFEFVRPYPSIQQFSGDSLNRLGPGGCFDCEAVAAVTLNRSGADGPVVRAKIRSTDSPQKNLSGSMLSRGIGVVLGPTEGAGILRAMGEYESLASVRADHADVESLGFGIFLSPPLHVGGVISPSGSASFSAQNDRFDSGYSPPRDEVIDVVSVSKIDMNNAGVYTAKIRKKGTSTDPLPVVDTKPLIRSKRLDRGSVTAITGNETYPESVEIEVKDCRCAGQARNCSLEDSNVVLSGIVFNFTGGAVFDCRTNCGSSTQAVTLSDTESSLQQIGGCETDYRLYSSSPMIISKGSEISGNRTISSIVGHPSEFRGPFCSAPDPSGPSLIRNLGLERMDSATASFGVANAYCSEGFVVADLPYSILHTRYVDIPIHIEHYWSYTTRTSSGVGKYLDRVSTLRFSITRTINRVAKFSSTIKGDLCFRTSGGDTALLFQSDEFVSDSGQDCFTAASAEIAMREIISREYNYSSDAATVFIGPFDPTIPDISRQFDQTQPQGLFFIGGMPWGTHSTGEVHLFSGTFDWHYPNVCGISPFDMFPDPNFGDCPGVFLTDDPAGAICRNKYYATIARDSIFRYSSSPLASACPVPTPTVIDFSSSKITVTKGDASNLTGHFAWPSDYSVHIISPDDYSGKKILSIHEDWNTFSSLYINGEVESSLSTQNGILEMYQKPGSCQRIVARYRIAGFPFSRWNRHGNNQMMLVSADHSLGKWPIFITVEPA